MMVFEFWLDGEEGGKGEGAEGKGKDADAFSILTSGLSAFLGSHLAFSNTRLAKR